MVSAIGAYAASRACCLSATTRRAASRSFSAWRYVVNIAARACGVRLLPPSTIADVMYCVIAATILVKRSVRLATVALV
jgi:hypothetical protein